MGKMFLIPVLLILAQEAVSIPQTGNDSGNFLRVSMTGRKDSDPSESERHSFRADGDVFSVYEKGPVLPGAGVRKQHFFVSEDYTVFDGPRKRLVPFFDPEKWMNCNCDVPFPLELDIPPRFAVYNPVTVQAPLPSVPKDLLTKKYTGFYYTCPTYVNPFEFAFYQKNQDVNPCRWVWYQSVKDAGPKGPKFRQ